MISLVFSGAANLEPPLRGVANSVRFASGEYPPSDKAIFVSGSSTAVGDLPALGPYAGAVQLAMGHLAANGYKVITGGYSGIGEAAMEGANGNSYIVEVTDWPGIDNRKLPNNKFLYAKLKPETSGLQRTDRMIRATRFVIVAPGGIGTLEELSAILEAMYYKAKYDGSEAVPEKIILLDGPMPSGSGKSFWAPLLELVGNMNDFGVSRGDLWGDSKGHNRYISVVSVDKSRRDAAKDIIQAITGERPSNLSVRP